MPFIVVISCMAHHSSLQPLMVIAVSASLTICFVAKVSFGQGSLLTIANVLSLLAQLLMIQAGITWLK